MSFLPIAIIGYLFNAAAILVDKFLVERKIPDPIVYTFYLQLLGALAVLLLIPLGFEIPGLAAALLAFLSGGTFVMGSLAFFFSLKYDEASRVAPIVGTLNAIFTFLIGFFIFSQSLNLNQGVATVVLILGLILLSSTTWFKSKIEREHLLFMALSAFFFAASVVLLREVFLRESFITGIVSMKVATFLIALSFLIPHHTRQQIIQSRLTKHHFINSTSRLLIIGQLSGALGGLLLSFSITLVNPAVVNAIQGVQYVFILGVVLILSRKYQHLLDEEMTKKTKLQKIIGSVVIGLGLLILAL